MNGSLEAASIPAAVVAHEPTDVAAFANRLALGLAAGLIAVLDPRRGGPPLEPGAHLARPARLLSA